MNMIPYTIDDTVKMKKHDTLDYKLCYLLINFYHTSACNACRAWYCFTNSVCLSVYLSVRPMPVLCIN